VKRLNDARSMTKRSLYDAMLQRIPITDPGGGEEKSFSEADSYSADQEIPHLKCNTFHYHIQKTLPLDPILSQMNSVHIFTLCLQSILIVSTPLCLCLPNGLLPSHFPLPKINHNKLPKLNCRCYNCIQVGYWVTFTIINCQVYEAMDEQEWWICSCR
jgi:hypothetical protein